MPYAGDLDAQVLQWIWAMAEALAALAVCIVAVLTVRHARAERAKLHRMRMREELERLMRGALYSPASSALPRIDRALAPLALDIALDWLRFIRGAEVQRIVAMLQAWRVTAYVEERLVHGTPAQKIAALTYYGYCEDEQSLANIVSSAAREAGQVQLSAVRALAARSAAEHLPVILQALGRDARAPAMLIADVLRRFGERGVPHLVSAAQSALQVEIRCGAISALAAIGARDAVNAVAALCADADPRVRVCALEALRRLGIPRSDEALARALADARGDVRAAAAAAVGALGIRRLAGALTTLLHDAEWSVRYSAADALRGLGAAGIEILKRVRVQQNEAGLISGQVLAEAGEG